MEKYASHGGLGGPALMMSALLTLMWAAPVWADRVDDIISEQMSAQLFPSHRAR
jgi:hypothetical protein